MFEKERPYFKLPKPKPEYQSVTIDLAKAVKNPAAIRQLQIGMNPLSDKLTFFIRNIEVLGNPEKQPPCQTAEAIVVHAPGTVFVQNEPLRFTFKQRTFQAPEWILKNWKGEIIRTGIWPQTAKRELLLPPLPNGYYTLHLSSNRQKFSGLRSFVVVPDPATRSHNP